MSRDEILLNINVETGEQGPVTDTVLKLAEKIPGEDMQLIHNIADYIHSLKNVDTLEPNFTRTADQIIQSGEQWGCHEAGLVFVTLLRANNIQATYIETFLKEDLTNYQGEGSIMHRGHVFVRMHTDKNDKIINSTTGEVTNKIPDKYVSAAEGLDSWDIGLRLGLEDYLQLFEKTKDLAGL